MRAVTLGFALRKCVLYYLFQLQRFMRMYSRKLTLNTKASGKVHIFEEEGTLFHVQSKCSVAIYILL